MKKPRVLYIKNPAAQVRTVENPLDRKKIGAICAKIASLPVLDSRTPDEILGYDSIGVVR